MFVIRDVRTEEAADALAASTVGYPTIYMFLSKVELLKMSDDIVLRFSALAQAQQKNGQR